MIYMRHSYRISKADNSISIQDVASILHQSIRINEVFQTLIEHWNSSKWSVVTSPNIGTGSNDLESVAAISSNNVWAVGSGAINTSSSRQTVIEHWDGTKWSIISS